MSEPVVTHRSPGSRDSSANRDESRPDSFSSARTVKYQPWNELNLACFPTNCSEVRPPSQSLHVSLKAALFPPLFFCTMTDMLTAVDMRAAKNKHDPKMIGLWKVGRTLGKG